MYEKGSKKMKKVGKWNKTKEEEDAIQKKIKQKGM